MEERVSNIDRSSLIEVAVSRPDRLPGAVLRLNHNIIGVRQF